MYLSKHSNGYYYIYFNTDTGKRNSISTRTKTKAEAIKFLSSFKEEIKKRQIEKLNSVTLFDYVNNFLAQSVLNHTKKTVRTYKLSLKYLKLYLGNVTLKEITPSKMTEYFQQRTKSSSIYQSRKDLICINSLFNRAIAEGYLISNPCKEIRRYRIPEKQPLYFSEKEFTTLLSIISDIDLKDIVIFAVQTGLRQMEIITLTWSQINFKDGLLILDNREQITKSKKIRTIPLTLTALQILTKRQITGKTELIFTNKGKMYNQNQLSRYFKQHVIKAGINDKLNFHSLRHTFASWLIQKGISIFIVSKLLGHSDIKTTIIYSHLRAEDLRNSINSLNLLNF